MIAFGLFASDADLADAGVGAWVQVAAVGGVVGAGGCSGMARDS